MRERADEGPLDRAFVRERVDHALVARVVERDPVGRAVLSIDPDDPVGARGERAAQRPAQVLAPVGAVDEDQREPLEVGRAEPGVVQLDESAGVGTDLVVVDLVQDEDRQRLRRRRVLAPGLDDAARVGPDDDRPRQP